MWGTGLECPWQVRGTTLVVSGMVCSKVDIYADVIENA